MSTSDTGNPVEPEDDETGTDDSGAADETELPEGITDDGFDGSDVGDGSDDPGQALPDDPHNIGAK